MNATASIIEDRFGAFVAGPRANLAPHQPGPLAGLSFAVKDLFDIAGVPTGAGNPSWAAIHPIPDKTAPVVATLAAAGASLAGKTLTDELAYSLMGQNHHYGTPINPAAPDRMPGGSSSGSAVAVAGGLVDFAIGTDTGGSVRLPASFCGIFGFRPSHGRIDMTGVVPLSPGFDVAGWFARDHKLLGRVGAALGIAATTEPLGGLMIAEDSADRLDARLRPAFAAIIRKLEACFGPAERVTLAPAGLAAWRETFRIYQAAEAWAAHGAWIRAAKPLFGPGVAERFAAAERLTPEEIAQARAERAHISRHLAQLLEGKILCLPTAPGPAPFRTASQAEQQDYRVATLELLCPAGLGGLPQISLPLMVLDGAPVGISLIAAHGEDERLLAAVDLAMAVC